MKRLLVTICALALVFVCKESLAQQKQKMKNGQKNMNKVARMDSTPYPYTAGYSSDFQMGNPVYARKVLELWKDYDDNTFENHDYFADTAVMFLSNGMVIKGKDSIYTGAKNARASMSNVTSTVDAWVPLKSVDKNENWVAIWGTEISTGSDGKVEKEDLQEIWGFNKDGKVVFMKQFASKVPAETQQ
jgi:hypothetical protein